jgi:TolB protein
MAPDGTGSVVLDTPRELGDPTISWAPDSGRFVYVKKDSGSQLFVADVATGTSVPVGDSSLVATNPQWSPKGDLIAFTGLDAATGNAIYVVPAAGGPARLVAAPAGGVELGPPVWSPDGTTLAVFAGDGGAHDIYTVRPDGSSLRNLMQSGHDEFYPVWSNAGTRIAYERIDAGQPFRAPQVNDVVRDAGETPGD